MWDSFQPQDQCGSEIFDWILNNDLHILNDSSATQASQISANGSTLDSPSVGVTGQRKHLGV